MSSRLPRRRTRVLSAAVAAVVAAVLAGCGSSGSDTGSGGDDASKTRVFKADNGDITIPVDPKRVVATGYAVPALIEADASLVGISSWKRGLTLMTAEDRATYDKLEKIAGELAAETNYEAIEAAKPDLIVIGVPKVALADIDIERLEATAPVVAIGPTIPDAWRELSKRQADAAGRLDNFEAGREAYNKKAKEIADKYKAVLADLDFGHLGGYGQVAQGTFQREFAKSWGTNVAGDVGVKYYGEVKTKGAGSLAVAEYPSIEDLPASFAQAEVITYTVQPDGAPSASVKYVLDSPLWQNLPAVKAGKVFPIKYTEAATYPQAMLTLASIEESLAPLLTK